MHKPTHGENQGFLCRGPQGQLTWTLYLSQSSDLDFDTYLQTIPLKTMCVYKMHVCLYKHTYTYIQSDIVSEIISSASL